MVADYINPPPRRPLFDEQESLQDQIIDEQESLQDQINKLNDLMKFIIIELDNLKRKQNEKHNE